MEKCDMVCSENVLSGIIDHTVHDSLEWSSAMFAFNKYN